MNDKLLKSLYWYIIEDSELYEYVYDRIDLGEVELAKKIESVFKRIRDYKINKPILYFLKNNEIDKQTYKNLARILIQFFH